MIGYLGSRRSSTGLVALPLGLVFLVGGCTTVGGVASTDAPQALEPPVEEVAEVPVVAGSWSGFLSIEGSNLDATLEVEQSGSEVTLVLEAPDLRLTATGGGRIAADRKIEFDARYETQCPGVARLRGVLEADGLQMSGPLEVEDCTGGAAGAFLFNR